MQSVSAPPDAGREYAPEWLKSAVQSCCYLQKCGDRAHYPIPVALAVVRRDDVRPLRSETSQVSPEKKGPGANPHGPFCKKQRTVGQVAHGPLISIQLMVSSLRPPRHTRPVFAPPPAPETFRCRLIAVHMPARPSFQKHSLSVTTNPIACQEIIFPKIIFQTAPIIS